jgi:mannose-6-phosphate isomerase
VPDPVLSKPELSQSESPTTALSTLGSSARGLYLPLAAIPVICKIEPIFSPRPWGARSLAPLFPAKTNLSEPLGEAWLTGFDCKFANGPYADQSLKESWRAMPVEWRGSQLKDYPDFPVLIKFIFPQDKLSIQVHPDDAFASLHEIAAGGRGKTEMWHIVSAQPEGAILLGLKAGVTRELFEKAIGEKNVEGLLEKYPVKAGETYFVPARTQHAVLPGMIICEVQEYSDLTYRVDDYGRLDAAGKPRELHLQKALEVTNFADSQAGKVRPLALHSPDANKHLLAACDFFATERWDCCKTTFLESDPQHFQVLVILEGSGTFHDTDVSFDFHAGETWFLPATLPVMMLQPKATASLLRVFVPQIPELRRELVRQGFDETALSRVLFT